MTDPSMPHPHGQPSAYGMPSYPPGQMGPPGQMEPQAEPAVPPVPAGPGTRAPFPMAPAEGRNNRLGWGLGIAGLALVLCCVGGLVGVGGLLVTGTKAIQEQVQVVMGDYLGAIRDERYATAYDLLCPAEKQRMTLSRFTDVTKAGPRLASYEVGQVPLNTTELVVPVSEHYADGTTEQESYLLLQDPKTATLEVCGTR